LDVSDNEVAKRWKRTLDFSCDFGIIYNWRHSDYSNYFSLQRWTSFSGYDCEINDCGWDFL